MSLQPKLSCGAAVLSVVAGLAMVVPATAQTAQGQFTPDANAPIQLHMPVHLHLPPKPKAKAVRHHRASVASPGAQAAAAAPAPTEAKPIPVGSPAQTERPRPAARSPSPRQTAAHQAPEPSQAQRRKTVHEVLSGSANATSSSSAAGEVSAPNAAIPFSFDSAPPPPKSGPQASNPPKQKIAVQTAPAAKPKPGSAPPRPRGELATLTPPPKQPPVSKQIVPPEKPKGDPHAGLTKQGEILFEGTSTDPQSEGASALKASADKLNGALDKGAANVQIEAFGGAPGDKSSEARRLSLRRALAVRQLLIDGGIPATRIVVKAEGGADDKGNPQRVDVYLRGAPG